MGKAAKGSRKGKKAWRANISTDDIHEYFEKETKDTLSGAKAIASLPSDSLFFVDKSIDQTALHGRSKTLTISSASLGKEGERGMGKAAKGSRKGKKAWRANISTDDIHEYFEKETKDTLSGAKAIASLPSDSLFFVDKSIDIPIKRKIEKHREKILHCESVLQRNTFVQPVPSSILKKCKKKRKSPKVKTEGENISKEEESSASAVLDAWDTKGGISNKAKKRSTTSIVPAVEVESSGCSFNPPFEAHQDSLGQAVADEMQKVFQKELGPQPVPLIVPGEIMDEEDKYFLDADDGDEGLSDEDLDNATEGTKRQLKAKRVTRVQLNRRVRRKDQLRAEAEAKKLEIINKEIDCLPDIIEEIAKEDVEKNRRRMRRVVAKQDRLRSFPPRLGKHRFEPAPIQVLLKEEISGSLRKLKGCCTLARDRYKSLEKRGILVPRAKHNRRK